MNVQVMWLCVGVGGGGGGRRVDNSRDKFQFKFPIVGFL